MRESSGKMFNWGASHNHWAVRLLVLLAVLCIAVMPSFTQAAFVGPASIAIDGTSFADWTGNVYSQADGTNSGGGIAGAGDITAVWCATSTATGTSPASSSNLMQNVYYRFDTALTTSTNPRQAYWVQLNLGTASIGYADHVLQFYVDTTNSPAVAIVLYSYSAPYPAIAAFTTGSLTPQVSNQTSGFGTYDSNATGAWALNGSTYSFEAKIPIGWFGSTYLGSVKTDGTGASAMITAFFTSTGSVGSVGTVKDQLDNASGNCLYGNVSMTTGTVIYATGDNFFASAGAATLTPVAGASDTITLTVKKADSTTDTGFSGARNVTISGFLAAPDGSYGVFNGTILTGSPQTISVTFTSGMASPGLVLKDAASQTIGFSISGVTNPDTNTITITPTAGTAAALKMQTQPVGSSSVGGGPLATQPVVRTTDAYQNVVPNSSASVLAAAKSGSGSWSLGGTTTKTASSGVAAFTDLTGTTSSASDITTAVITFTSSGLSSVDSSAFTVKAATSSPSISSVGLYQTDHTTSVTVMSPQTEYAMKVTVSNASTLATLSTVKVTIFYDADGIYAPGDVPSSGNAQTAAILTCTVGGTPGWSIDPGAGSTWSIVSANCVQPTLTNATGDFWFHFKAGKVATATTGSAKWHVYAKATSAGGVAANYQNNRAMNWFGEITVNTPNVDFGSVALGSDFSGNPKTSISVTYICNGNYTKQVKINSPWTGGGNSVLLNAAGSPGVAEFSLKADDTATLSSAVFVSTGYVTIGTAAQTSESGNTESTNTLWLKLGASGLPAVTYNGTVYYGIAQ